MSRRRLDPRALRRLHLLGPGAAADPVVEAPIAPAKPRRARSPHRRRRLLTAIWATALVLAAGLVLLLVLPTRSWLQQRESLASAAHTLEVIEAENERLAARVEALKTPEEIARVARQQYNLVPPGEHAFSVMPAPAPSLLPDVWPYTVVKQIVASKSGAATSTSVP